LVKAVRATDDRSQWRNVVCDAVKPLTAQVGVDKTDLSSRVCRRCLEREREREREVKIYWTDQIRAEKDWRVRGEVVMRRCNKTPAYNVTLSQCDGAH